MYTRINWEDYPNTKTPINAENLNKMDVALDGADVKVSTESTINDTVSGGLKINEIRGKTEQKKLSGKNLFDISKVKNAFGIVNNGDSLTITASEGSSAVKAGKIVEYAPNIEVGQEYVINANTTGEIKYIYIIDTKTILLFGKPFIATSEIINSDIYFYASGVSTTAIISEIQLEKGTVATPYEPYTGGIPSPNPEFPQEIENVVIDEVVSCGKNIFSSDRKEDKSHVNLEPTSERIFDYNKYYIGYAMDGYCYDYNITGYEIKSDSINVKSKSLSYGIGFPIKVNQGEKYSISTELKEKNIGVGFFDKKGINIAYDNNKYQFTIPDKCETLLIVFKPTKIDEFSKYTKVQLEKGSTPTSYEPYKSTIATLPSITLAKGDKIVKRDGLWGSYKSKGIVTFDGSEDENWERIKSSNSQMCGISIENPYTPNDDYINGISNRFTSTTEKDVVGGQSENVFAIATFKKLIIKTDIFDGDIPKWKTWLLTHPLTVEYELETPTFVPFEPSVQKQLNSLKTYDNQTNISTNSELQPIIESEYGKSKLVAYTLEALNNSKNCLIKEV